MPPHKGRIAPPTRNGDIAFLTAPRTPATKEDVSHGQKTTHPGRLAMAGVPRPAPAGPRPAGELDTGSGSPGVARGRHPFLPGPARHPRSQRPVGCPVGAVQYAP